MKGCVFCDIISGKAEASIVIREDVCLAFMDLVPVNPGHVLVAPVSHAARLADLPSDVAGRMFQLAIRLASALRVSGVRCEAVNVQMADGVAAGQSVDHVHLHVIPRFEGDGFGLRLPPHYPTEATLDERHRVAEAIRRALRSTEGALEVLSEPRF